jgi:hypothetical protein
MSTTPAKLLNIMLLLHLLRIILKVCNIEGAQSDKRCEFIRVDLVNQWRSIIVALLQKDIIEGSSFKSNTNAI